MKKFSYWNSLEKYLDELGLFRMKPGQERINAALEVLRLKRPPFLLAQGVGTNGKGSTCAFLASLAREHGFVCGLHTSPHFLSVRERIRLLSSDDTADQPGCSRGGRMFSEADWLDGANRIMEHGGEALTYFELITVLAVQLFTQAGVDLAVMETGLGGRFDATTALDADLVFFTPIDLDHAEVLGPTLGDIARDKAGAMRSDVPAISAAQKPEVRRELEATAASLGVELTFSEGPKILPEALQLKTAQPIPGQRHTHPAHPDHPDHPDHERHAHEPPAPRARLPLGLAGRHQYVNASLALQAWRALYPALRARKPFTSPPADQLDPMEVNEDNEVMGLTQAWLPGRLQFIEASAPGQRLSHPPLLLDGAHNPHGMAALGHSLALLGIAPPVTIFSCLADKQPEKLVPHLRVLSAGLIIVPQIQNHPRAMDAQKLAELIGRPAIAVENLAQALHLAHESIMERLPEIAEQSIHECKYPLLVCGSLYLLGEFYQLYPEYLSCSERNN